LPGEEGNQDDEDAEADGGNVISLPDEEDLDHEENEDGNGNEERSAVTILISATCVMGLRLSIELTVAVELVEPDDDESNDDGEGNIEHSASAVILTGDVGTVHTIHVENTDNGNSDIDEPRIIHKGTHAVRTSADILGNISLGTGEEVEANSEENET